MAATFLVEWRGPQESVLQAMGTGFAPWVVPHVSRGASAAPTVRTVRAPVLGGESGGWVGRIPISRDGPLAGVAPYVGGAAEHLRLAVEHLSPALT